jgi:hypothetical protein
MPSESFTLIQCTSINYMPQKIYFDTKSLICIPYASQTLNKIYHIIQMKARFANNFAERKVSLLHIMLCLEIMACVIWLKSYCINWKAN